jgi:hypothetical protein
MRSVSKSICHTQNLFVLIRIELDVSVASQKSDVMMSREPAWPIIATICSDLQQDFHDLRMLRMMVGLVNCLMKTLELGARPRDLKQRVDLPWATLAMGSRERGT